MANEHKPALAPYPEMIIAAIESLNDPNGSNKSSIHKQIELKYGALPPAASTLLVHHLNKMKSAGELVFYKNNYFKSDPNSPARRGRGRPPKPRDPNAPEPEPKDENAPKRGRGRPPKKARDPNAPPTSPVVASGKKRGRPAKINNGEATKLAEEDNGEVKEPVKESSEEAPRGRGRPKKLK